MNQTLFKVDVYKASYPDLHEILSLCDSDYVKSLPFNGNGDAQMPRNQNLFNDNVVSTAFNLDDGHGPGAVHLHPLFTKIREFIESHAKVYWDSIDYFPEANPKIYQSWINLHKHGGNIASHCHGRSALAAVFYLNASPAHGNIVFENPLDLLWQVPYIHTEKQFYQEIPVFTGDLYIYPGWLKHHTKSNTTGNARMVFAMNLNATGEYSNYLNNPYV